MVLELLAALPGKSWQLVLRVEISGFSRSSLFARETSEHLLDLMPRKNSQDFKT